MPHDGPRDSSELNGNEPESISALIVLAQGGDQAALDRLFQRCYPMIRRLAHGRLPARIRAEMDTPDLVQITFLRAWRGLEKFQSRWEDGWLVYLRRILFNYLRDEGRRARRLPDRETLPSDDGPGAIESGARTPPEETALRDKIAAYRGALEQLSERERCAVVLRLEQGERYEAIAGRLGLPSSDAARMLVKRSVGKIADMLDPPGKPE
jgi:RNA polymerase sigma-70 factor, ECF subfamily